MNASSNPLIRPQNPFSRRLVDLAEMAKPRFGVGVYSRPFPGGTSLEVDGRKGRGGSYLTGYPFKIDAKGKVYPGNVGLVMPEIDGDPLDATTNVIDLMEYGGNFKVWFALSFEVVFLSDFLSSYTLESVDVQTGTTVPSDSYSTKYLQFNTITAGKPAPSFVNRSFDVSLCDNGANATLLHYSFA